jgi:hypothetical protein
MYFTLFSKSSLIQHRRAPGGDGTDERQGVAAEGHRDDADAATFQDEVAAEDLRGSYTPPVGGAGTRGRVPRVRGCLVGPRPMRFTVFVFSFFQISTKFEI